MRPRIVLSLLLALGSSAPAGAHFAPSETENNRYAKIVLLPEAVRISYTVFFGQRPGAAERRRMDVDRDTLISEAEARDFARRLRDEIAPRIDVELDGVAAKAEWRVVDLGLGTPTAAGGAFALDLFFEAPLADPTAERHDLWLEDRWNPPLPGETEVKIEESPGVHVLEAHARRDGRGAQRSFQFRGAATTPGERGIFVAFRVDEELRRRHAPPRPRRFPVVLVVVASAIVVAGAAGATALILFAGRKKR